MKTPLVITLTMVILGVGCVSTPISDVSSEDAAAALTLQAGTQIVLRPTILGVGGGWMKWVRSEVEDRQVTMDEWAPGDHAKLSWSITSKIETEESKVARKAYDEQYASSPVGVEIPEPPDPAYEEMTQAGSVSTISLASGTTLSLPETWPEGEGGESASTLIWLSKSQYDELASTRSTTLSLGLFDESLAQVEETASRVESLMDRVAGLLGQSNVASSSATSFLTISADSKWGSYSLVVNGERTTVRTIEAKNKFANLTILANSENPLVLEVTLTPLARGSLNLLSTKGLAEGFGGYEVVSITRSETSSADPRPR